MIFIFPNKEISNCCELTKCKDLLYIESFHLAFLRNQYSKVHRWKAFRKLVNFAYENVDFWTLKVFGAIQFCSEF